LLLCTALESVFSMQGWVLLSRSTVYAVIILGLLRGLRSAAWTALYWRRACHFTSAEGAVSRGARRLLSCVLHSCSEKLML
jgi:hypothetical protein